jgi:regulatory protein
MSDSCDQPFRKAWNSALRILAHREHSVAELAQKLSRRGHAAEVVRHVIAECLRLNYLNDQRVVQQVLARVKRKGFGIHRVRSELRKRGLAGSESEDDLCESMSPTEEHVVARRVALKKRARLMHDPDPTKRTLRLQRFLRSRGFSDAVVLEVLAALDMEQDEDHPANN